MSDQLAASELTRLGTRPRLGPYLRQLWLRREFILTVPLGELRAQHMNTALGSLWHLLNPLINVGVYYLIFGVVLGARDSADNYVGFLVVGLFTFHFVQKATMSGARIIVANLPLLQNLSFPRASLPMAGMLGEMLAQIPAVAVMLLLVAVTGESWAWQWLLVVPSFLLLAAFNLGLAFITGRLTFHFRDIQELLPYLLRIWFYLSGVFFGIEKIPADPPIFRQLFRANPAQAFIEFHRGLLLDGSVDTGALSLMVGWALVLLVAGFFFFRQYEAEYGRGY